MALLVGEVDALEAVDVPGEASLADVGLAALDGLGQRVVQEDVLLLRLDQVVPLPPDVLQVREHVDVAARRDLPHHGVQHDVAARAAHPRAAKRNQTEFEGLTTLARSSASRFEREARRMYIPKEIIPTFPIGMQLPEAVYNILARISNAKSEAGQERLEAERGREGGGEW